MDEDFVMSLGAEALKTTVFLASPMLISAMIVGIGVSILQAITQINEATLTFIPKMVAITIVFIVLGPWMLELIRDYTMSILVGMGEQITR